jgi:hypothetical protein
MNVAGGFPVSISSLKANRVTGWKNASAESIDNVYSSRQIKTISESGGGKMKKTCVILLAVLFVLAGVGTALADHGNSGGHGGKGSSHGGSSGYHGGHGGYHGNGYGYHHGGHKYSHHGYKHNGHYKHCGHGHDDWYDYGWEAAAIGLGAAVVGSAIVNSYYREPVTVVEHHTYYEPVLPPPPCRVWVPGHYIYEPGGHYTYVPGYYQ